VDRVDEAPFENDGENSQQGNGGLVADGISGTSQSLGCHSSLAHGGHWDIHAINQWR